ncbi:MAG TPA: class I SAM-dependent methyltransferase [Terracidiphilus sp.]|nr:class I SAM-dependent methyltransferase [Terracidiphilus sp.]
MSAVRSSALHTDPATETSAPNFNSLARSYRWMEYATFGPWLWWCRRYFLPALKNSRRAVILGDGDGRFTARLLATNPAIHVDAVDASPSMLQSLLQNAGPRAARVSVHWADARRWQPTASVHDQSYDLIVTHFFLDCLTTKEVRDLAERLRVSLGSDALWVVSEFAAPRNWFGHVVARPIIAALYAAFGLLTGLRVRALPDYDRVLRESGFRLGKRKQWLGGLLVSELWSFAHKPPPL